MSEREIDALVATEHGARDRPLRQRQDRAPHPGAAPRRRRRTDRIIIGNDAPSGTGVVPLGILRVHRAPGLARRGRARGGDLHGDRQYRARLRAAGGRDRAGPRGRPLHRGRADRLGRAGPRWRRCGSAISSASPWCSSTGRSGSGGAATRRRPRARPRSSRARARPGEGTDEDPQAASRWWRRSRRTAGGRVAKPIKKVAAVAVIENPFAGRYRRGPPGAGQDRRGAGRPARPPAVMALGGPVHSYGKAAIVGDGRRVRARGGASCIRRWARRSAPRWTAGKAIIPSAKKLGGPGHAHRRAAPLQGRGLRPHPLRRDGGARAGRAEGERDPGGPRGDGRRPAASPASAASPSPRPRRRTDSDERHGLRLPSFALGPQTASLPEMGAYLRRAEDLGFDCAVAIDHLLLTPPAYACTWLEPVAMLAALAGVTRTIRLGTMVLVLPLRNPAYFAKEWATLDLLSGGRTILGVGVGWHEEEFALMGVPHRSAGRRMDEMLEAVTALWAGDNVTYEGKYYTFREPDDRSQARAEAAPAHLDRRRHPALGEGLRPDRPQHRPGAAAHRQVRRRPGCPHSSATAEMVKGDWEKIQRFMGEFGRKPDDMDEGLLELRLGAQAGREAGVGHSRTSRSTPGMDLDYWQEFYLLGEAEELADRIRAQGRRPGRLRVHRAEPARLGARAARAAGRRGAAAGGQRPLTRAPPSPALHRGPREAARGPAPPARPGPLPRRHPLPRLLTPPSCAARTRTRA